MNNYTDKIYYKKNVHTAKELIESFEKYGFKLDWKEVDVYEFEHETLPGLGIHLKDGALPKYSLHYLNNEFRFYLEGYNELMTDEFYRHITRLYHINKKEFNYYNKVANKEND